MLLVLIYLEPLCFRNNPHTKKKYYKIYLISIETKLGKNNIYKKICTHLY